MEKRKGETGIIYFEKEGTEMGGKSKLYYLWLKASNEEMKCGENINDCIITLCKFDTSLYTNKRYCPFCYHSFMQKYVLALLVVGILLRRRSIFAPLFCR